MNDKFDQLAKVVAESVTRRQALERFAGRFVGMPLACFGLSSKADQSCVPSGEFCGNGVRSGNCHRCCSGSFFCEHSEDVNKTCFCN